jgi:hypothetical protein
MGLRNTKWGSPNRSLFVISKIVKTSKRVKTLNLGSPKIPKVATMCHRVFGGPPK